ncbi:DUF2892 domain-containing protein [Gymnodinialimonas sp. 2305UL16-5]|uniref:YgaP family membrane protein n=1 Tax=Gymnodinialimonas mytili TaxID=3126503 RepID=UPI00309610D6
MTTNMGKLDRALRLVVAAGLLFAAFVTTFAGSGILFWVALIIAAVFTVTAFVGTCPLYRIIGLKTCQEC